MYSIFLKFLSIIIAINGNPIINLPYGSIMGLETTTYKKQTYYAFEKIPYATPPIGNLRFQAPQPPQKWNHTLNCTKLDVICHQFTPRDFKQSEDCLYLNVYTPQISETNNLSYPVMFYIHGGGFTDGSSKDYQPDLLIHKNIILVTINYRLGPYGFLSTQDSVISGNMGLKDQHLALKWVNNYIIYFGGNPQKITIFGNSAGSASIGYHLLNPKSEGLFWAAICQSGSVLAPWAYQRQPKTVAFKFASFLNNSFETNRDSRQLLEFLQTVEPFEILKAQNLYNSFVFGNKSEDIPALEGMTWAPTLETITDGFVVDKMFKLLKQGKFVKVPLLLGFTSEENLNYHLDVNEVNQTMALYDSNSTFLIPVDLPVSGENRSKVAEFIKNMYTNGTPFSAHWGTGIRFSSDNDMTRPIMKLAELFSKFSKTYFYVFTYNGEIDPYDIVYDDAGTVGHVTELIYLLCFTTSCNISNYPETDRITRTRVLQIWTDFAKFGNPTPKKLDILQNISWPVLVVDDNTFPYLDIGENLEIKNYPKQFSYKKWNQLYNSIRHDDFDTF